MLGFGGAPMLDEWAQLALDSSDDGDFSRWVQGDVILERSTLIGLRCVAERGSRVAVMAEPLHGATKGVVDRHDFPS